MRAVRFLLALMLMLSTALTASAATFAEQAGYEAFKRLVEKSSVDVDCLSKFQLIFHSPYAHGELSARGLELPGEKFDFNQGSIDVDVAAGGNVISFGVPFYAVEDGNKLELYAQWDNKWKKLSFDDISLNEADKHSAEDKMYLVNSATLLNDSDAQQIVSVAFDAVKIADLLESEKEKAEPEDAQKKEQSEQVNRLIREAFIKTGTINANFSIDKKTDLPLMIELDMSGLVMNLLNGIANNEEAAKIGASDLLNVLASTSSMKIYMVFDYSGKFDRKEFQLPKQVRKAEDITKDMLALAKIGSTKTP